MAETHERPILFSAPMVGAILEGHKTQTRRVIKPQPIDQGESFLVPRGLFLNCKTSRRDDDSLRCPYGVPGDRLWVRETWQQVHPLQITEGRFSLPGHAGIPGPPPVHFRVIYRADGEYNRLHFGPEEHPYRTLCSGDDCPKEHIHPEEKWHGWTPAIHMPRWASRITLEITAVRVERVQDINGRDAQAEGMEPDDCQGCIAGECSWSEKYAKPHELCPYFGQAYIATFRNRFKSWSGMDWDANPWIWVVEFKRIDTTKEGH